jgi:hypothetical protein
MNIHTGPMPTTQINAEVSRLSDGLELLDPGVVAVQNWRPRSEIDASAKSAMWGGVGRKR